MSRGFAGTTVAFCVGVAGYLALLSSEGRDRIRVWEQADPSEHYAPDTRPLAAAGRRVGTASVVLALCLPLFIPGLHMTRLFGGQPGIGGTAGGGGASAGFPDPNLQLSQDLKATTATPVLTYIIDRPLATCRSTRSTSSPTQAGSCSASPSRLSRSARGCPRRPVSRSRPG